MKKLTRSNVEELRKEMPVLTVSEERDVIGGTGITAIRINGGYLISYDYGDSGGKYTVYNPDNGGQSVVFDGVTISNSSAPDGSAYQLSGTIRVGDNPSSYFNIGLMIHEYGHYLQQQEKGTLAYLAYAGMGSLQGRLNDDTPYYQIPSEADASNRGDAYMNSSYPGSGYSAPH